MAAWAPGGGEARTPAGTGYLLQPGSQLVLQVHYNLLATGGRAGRDRSGIRLRLAAGSARLTAAADAAAAGAGRAALPAERAAGCATGRGRRWT